MLGWIRNLFGGGGTAGSGSGLGEGTAPGGPAAGEPGRTAARQRGEPEALERPGDPRGGLQSEEYRSAEPTALVEEGGTVMSGPGGAPQEGLSVEERREGGFGPAAQRSGDEHGHDAGDA